MREFVVAVSCFCVLLQGCWATSDECIYSLCNTCERKIEKCRRPDNKVVHCYSAWKNESGTVKLIKQGCFLNDITCSKGRDCIGRSHLRGVMYCCCTGNLCNENFTSVTNPESTYGTQPPTSEVVLVSNSTRRVKTNNQHRPLYSLLYSVPTVIVLAIILVLGFFMYYRHKTPCLSRGAITVDEELHMCVPPSPEMVKKNLPIQLVEVLSQGQYGTVWKANFLKETVAVKIISVNEKPAWLAERDFYTNCNLDHENILKFLAAERHGDCQLEYWLITEYHENGSLSDYLKKNVVCIGDFCKLTASLARGLSYLHAEVYEDKPCIAHRDIKSKNVLVKKDSTCSISDFGLAAKFEAGNTLGEAHGHVGTKRYMAPEVLEGAISFSRDSFLRIDVYALALVMWEILSRCTAAGGPVDEYRLPFEDEVGLHPSLEDMQQVVSQKKIRPKIRKDWHLNPGMALVCQTVEECWDPDAEARLTAECVYERLSQFFSYSYNSEPEQSSVVTPLINKTSAPSLESSV